MEGVGGVESWVDGDQKNEGMEEVVFSDVSDDDREGRGATGGELLQFELSRRGSSCEPSCVHQVQSDLHYDPGHSSTVFP